MATAVANGESGRAWRLRLPDRLPDLKGKWLTAYTVVWIVALLVAVAAPIRGTVLDHYAFEHPIWRPLGLLVGETDHDIRVIGVFGDEARRAAVRAGDRIIAVDGWPVGGRSSDDRLHQLLGGPRRAIATLTLRSPSGSDRQVVLASGASTADELFRGTGGSRATYDAAVYFNDLVFMLVLVPAAALLFVRRRREIVPALLSIAFLGITGFLTAGQTALLNAGIRDNVVGISASLLGWIPLVIGLSSFRTAGSSRNGWSRRSCSFPCAYSMICGGTCRNSTMP